MARGRDKLSARLVANLKEPGRYGDGGGLMLQVTAAETKSWIFRFMRNGRSHWMGLGPYPDIGLADAREAAQEQRRLLRANVDPLAAKRQQVISAKLEANRLTTFRQVASDYIEQHRSGWKNDKHVAQWEATMLGEGAATSVINDLPVGSVDTALVLKVLRPIWNDTPETARRVRGRVEAILDAAKAAHLREGENPARWKGHLSHLLTRRSKRRDVVHHAAVPFGEMPAFMTGLRANEAVSARALEFLILCAARTSEVTGAGLDEVDLQARLWTIPACRMKAGREHVVPLSDRAVEILSDVPREAGGTFVFPGSRKGRPLSNMAMLELLRGMRPGFTVHGFRSSFRDWAGDRSNFPREVIEAALAHGIQDQSEAAYRRSTAIEKRRLLMAAWARYCEQPAQAARNVTPLHEARA